MFPGVFPQSRAVNFVLKSWKKEFISEMFRPQNVICLFVISYGGKCLRF